MKRSILISIVLFASSLFACSQNQRTSAPVQFTKAELLAFSDLKAILSAINQGRDYSKYIVRNFNLTLISTNANKVTTVVSETGPGGVWSEKQKTMIEKYANNGVEFTLDHIVMMEGGKKGTIDQSNVSFTIKE